MGRKILSWTSERIQLLKDMWRDGFSGTQIGGKVGKSRSAVMGMIHRLKRADQIELRKDRPTPKVKIKAKIKAIPTSGLKINPSSKSTLEKKMFLPEAEPILAPKSIGISLWDIGPFQCREVIGHNGQVAIFCGSPTVEETSWCQFHKDKNFVRRGNTCSTTNGLKKSGTGYTIRPMRS